ncbi:glycosyltransferase [Pseudomonas sp. TNT2022 ID1044]|uniref:glycosyltransferase n=1 Tax=Pseudomonas sp. TNT2022 ID1044 TaxID=2942636 RepID=UPI0023615143|nr:glycosyltransferase [Pseudomonas sp. TNT2022 ID1044]MDD0998604.1 glycosyltransferase [Pseudomonas sp. TNT2022 ID1044]
MRTKPFRVMWLLNHGAARKFELQMLRSLGVSEFFLPKSFPQEIGFRSASIDWTEDANLTIPAEDLAILNEQNWFVSPSKEAWDIANKYFNVCFFICHSKGFMNEVSRSFSGAAIWHAYGLDKTLSYTEVVKVLTLGTQSVKKLGRRLWLGIAYEHLADSEAVYLQKRKSFLPLGLSNCTINDVWNGSQKHIFFVCPDIGFSSYYKKVYENFVSDMQSFPYKIGGSQPIEVDDPNVLGFVTNEEHENNMRESRVMFYHSSEPNHIHYHPFEAIRVGMPLIFMGGGILDRMGGLTLPGRCETVKEARDKIRRILKDDWKFIEQVRSSQAVLLEPMRAQNCEAAWQSSFKEIMEELEVSRLEQSERPAKRKKIAVVVPVEYRGGSLRGARLLAEALHAGSRQWGEDVDVVLLHLKSSIDPSEDSSEKDERIQLRSFQWKILDAQTARRAMRYAGHEGWEPDSVRYVVPDDGIKQLLDCDAWIVVSDRVAAPLVPLRPCIFMVYDYLQRYENVLSRTGDENFISAVRRAQKVLVTTEFTKQDAIQYAGVELGRIAKVPMLAPEFSKIEAEELVVPDQPYFLWTTNTGAHKNHESAIKALKFYYETLAGQLECHVTGVNTGSLLESKLPHLKTLSSLVGSSFKLQQKVKWLGELPDFEYRCALANANFVWHAGKIDNGSFSVVEAAGLGVPALSSDYPAMREMDSQFSLQLSWMNAGDYKDMALKLKEMELTYLSKKALLPSPELLAEQGVEKLAGEYWGVIRECL